MKLIRFIFFKVYSFYKKRWPQHDPEIYAVMYLSLITTFTIGIFKTILTDAFFNDTVYGWPQKIVSILFVVIVFIFYWKYFISGEKYLAVNKNEFGDKWYNGTRGKATFTMVSLLPVVLFVLSFFTNKE